MLRKFTAKRLHETCIMKHILESYLRGLFTAGIMIMILVFVVVEALSGPVEMLLVTIVASEVMRLRVGT